VDSHKIPHYLCGHVDIALPITQDTYEVSIGVDKGRTYKKSTGPTKHIHENNGGNNSALYFLNFQIQHFMNNAKKKTQTIYQNQ